MSEIGIEKQKILTAAGQRLRGFFGGVSQIVSEGCSVCVAVQYNVMVSEISHSNRQCSNLTRGL